MNLLTHISISKLLYKSLKSKMKLDKKAFIYGNMKPDLTSKCLRKPHTLENYFTIVCDKADKLVNEDMLLKDFSTELGEVCHYVSDFFCQYHIDEEIFHKLKSHFKYELKLHFEFLRTMPKISIISNENEVRKDISSIITELRGKYLSKPAEMQKDIVYALSAALQICETIHYFSKQPEETILDNVIDAYQIMTITGGQS